MCGRFKRPSPLGNWQTAQRSFSSPLTCWSFSQCFIHKSCEFAEICRAGQVWSSHVFFDRRGNNPLCHHRSLIHAAQGLQEHLRLVERAEGLPFDNGVFEISVEKAAGISVEKAAGKSPGAFTIHDVNWPEAWLEADPDLPAKLQAERDRSIEVWRQTRLPKMPVVENATA